MNNFTCPEVKDIKSLIEIAQRNINYQNINSKILFDILPELIKLNNMIGMEKLKETIFYQIIYYLQDMHKKGENEYLHTVITGSPGSGKTSIAEILGKIYKNLGILSSEGTFTVAKREDFIAPYLGQTTIKTRVLLESCVGGVLLIDEAYSLGPGQKDRDSFSKEAIDTLNLFLSEHKNDFCCIIAGYDEEIQKCFFDVNKGLERRFQWTHKIDSYSEEDLARIMIKMINDINWEIVLSIEELVTIIKPYMSNFKNFGGDIENLLSKCKIMHAKRVFSLDSRHKCILTKEDLENAFKLLKKNDLDTDSIKNTSLEYLYT
jgi:SpoVK/Ycf46/Vps4 family AAA+-type ATPase